MHIHHSDSKSLAIHSWSLRITSVVQRFQGSGKTQTYSLLHNALIMLCFHGYQATTVNPTLIVI